MTIRKRNDGERGGACKRACIYQIQMFLLAAHAERKGINKAKYNLFKYVFGNGCTFVAAAAQWCFFRLFSFNFSSSLFLLPFFLLWHWRNYFPLFATHTHTYIDSKSTPVCECEFHENRYVHFLDQLIKVKTLFHSLRPFCASRSSLFTSYFSTDEISEPF